MLAVDVEKISPAGLSVDVVVVLILAATTLGTITVDVVVRSIAVALFLTLVNSLEVSAEAGFYLYFAWGRKLLNSLFRNKGSA